MASTGSITPEESGSRSHGNETVVNILQNSRIVASTLDDFLSYPANSVRGCLTILQKCSRLILQSQTNSEVFFLSIILILFITFIT